MNDATGAQGTLLGHPKGLYIVSRTALWERFSFYTMRGILTLYMTLVVLTAMGAQEGGARADAIYRCRAQAGTPHFYFTTKPAGATCTVSGIDAGMSAGQGPTLRLSGTLSRAGQIRRRSMASGWSARSSGMRGPVLR